MSMVYEYGMSMGYEYGLKYHDTISYQTLDIVIIRRYFFLVIPSSTLKGKNLLPKETIW